MSSAAPTAYPGAEVHPVWEELEADGPQVGIVIASEADRDGIGAACNELLERAITFELRVLSAHRNPREVAEYASTALLRGAARDDRRGRRRRGAAGRDRELHRAAGDRRADRAWRRWVAWTALLSVVQMPDGRAGRLHGGRTAPATRPSSPPRSWPRAGPPTATAAGRQLSNGAARQPDHARGRRPRPRARGSTRRWAGTATATPSEGVVFFQAGDGAGAVGP